MELQEQIAREIRWEFYGEIPSGMARWTPEVIRRWITKEGDGRIPLIFFDGIPKKKKKWGNI